MIDAGLIKAIGSHGTTATLPIVLMFSMFTTKDQHIRHVAESSRGYILDVVSQAASEPPGAFKDSLCRALQEAIAELCADAPTDSICEDREMYLERAGC